MGTTPVVPKPVTPQLTTLDKILGDAEIALAVLAGVGGSFNPGVASISTLLGKLVSIAGTAIKAHEAISGQPLDLSLLHEIEPVP